MLLCSCCSISDRFIIRRLWITERKRYIRTTNELSFLDKFFACVWVIVCSSCWFAIDRFRAFGLSFCSTDQPI